MTDRTQPDSGRATGAVHIIRYALELGLLWLDGDGRDKVREALDALDILEAQLEAVGAGGVHALSAAPARPTVEQVEDEVSMGHGAWDMVDPQELIGAVLRLAASPTPPAEQQACDTPKYCNSVQRCTAQDEARAQAAPKAAPGERRNTKTHDLLSTMIGLFLGHKQAIGYKPGSVIDKVVNEAVEHLKDWPYPEAAPQQEAQEPAHPACKSDMLVNGGALVLAIAVLRRAGKTEVADELAKTTQPAPAELEQLRERISRMGLDVDRAMRGHVNEQSPLGTQRLAAIAALAKSAPAPLSEMPYEKRKAIQEGEQISASDAWFHARLNMLDTLDRRNVFRAGFDRGWNAALAAQGDTP